MFAAFDIASVMITSSHSYYIFYLRLQVLVERFPARKPVKKKQRRKSKSGSKDSDTEEDKTDTAAETTKYLFVCNRWLARSEDDGQIVRELVPTDEQGKVLRKNSLISKFVPLSFCLCSLALW